MIIKNIFSLTTSITSLFIIILFSNIASKADENNIKYYSKDEGILSVMYHRFNETKYPSTNIQTEVFKKHIQIIKNSGFNFHNPNKFRELTKSSPTLEEIRNLINEWLLNKSNYLAGNSEINLSKFVKKGLITRTIEERQNDIKKEIYKEIVSKIRQIDLESQTPSRIVVLVELDYKERIMRNSGEFVNETSLNPLKVKYILGFSDKSWKLVDFVSGL